MSKAVLISIRPEWTRLILRGEKTIEVRKTRPKLETPFKCYIYQTLPKSGDWNERDGHVIGEFACDYIENYATFCSPNYATFYMKEENKDLILSIDFGATCLTEDDFFVYGNGNDLFGWHISKLKVYDKPKKLSEFRMYNTGTYVENGFVMPTKEIKRPPQSFCYVEELS